MTTALLLSTKFKVFLSPQMNGGHYNSGCKVGECLCGADVVIYHLLDADDDQFRDHSVVRCTGHGCKTSVSLNRVADTLERLVAEANTHYEQILVEEDVLRQALAAYTSSFQPCRRESCST